MDRTEFGVALRTWRERLRPADVGLPAGVRRRTPGLRREEVASLAGVSVDYLTRLEQGRGPHPSDAVLTALARTLRVTEAERDHLFLLAGGSPPLPGRIRSTVRPSVLRMLDRFTDLPALLLDAKSDVLAWNAMAEALLGDLSAVPLAERNIARLAFVGSHRIMASDDEQRERLDRAIASDLRRATGRYPDDPGLRALIDDLLTHSERFAEVWATHEVEQRHSNSKVILHPHLGRIELDCDVLHVQGDDQALIVYSAAPGSSAAQALELLRVIGLQELKAPSR